MCGIFGYYNRKNKRLDTEVLQAMGKAIVHRGPDDCGIFEGDSFALGNQRLSIIDIEGGHQPFVSDDGQIIVVQNGEIFNHIELAQELAQDGFPCKTHSDTEVLLRLYERDGIDFLHKLNGMFCIAIYDYRKESLYLVRDRIGVKPLFIHDDGVQLAFASEIKSLLETGVQPEMDEEALNLFLAYNYVPPPHTMFKNIKHLMPGHMMKIDAAGQQLSCWWDLTKLAHEEERSEDEWVKSFNETLDDAVRLRMRADVPFGAFLSGGVDSSTVVGLMSKHTSHPVQTFCIGFDDPRYDESEFAQEAADRFGCQHTSERVAPNMLDLWSMATYHCDQPHGDVSFLPTYKVSELAAKQVKMVLTGDGGDELFAGYDKYKNFFALPEAFATTEAEFRKTYCENISLFTDKQREQLFHSNIGARQKDFDVWKPVFEILNKTKHVDRINQALLVDMLLLLPGNNLVKPDRMGMAVSLEARTPFLDYRMMELAFSMPGGIKLKKGVTKYIFKKAVTPLIGENLAYRKKQMFTVPVGEWFKSSLLLMVKDLLLSERAISRQLFDVKYVSYMVESHASGTENFTRQIRALMAVELWCRKFLDKGC
ncbi:MAG: asparagine synthase (glutamine-hydrolyzing) [Ghiorsea sp.]|nr:asparagine synthase (glutamine-hydrolyzing) [Ghiorsea sp.]